MQAIEPVFASFFEKGRKTKKKIFTFKSYRLYSFLKIQGKDCEKKLKKNFPTQKV